MLEEATYVLTKAGVQDANDLLKEYREKMIRPIERMNFTAEYTNFYRNVSVQHIQVLRNIYEKEIYLFGYPDTPYVDFSYS